MFQIFLITAFIANQDPGLMQLASIEQRELPDISVKNSQKKSENTNPKIDIESLGLDLKDPDHKAVTSAKKDEAKNKPKKEAENKKEITKTVEVKKEETIPSIKEVVHTLGSELSEKISAVKKNLNLQSDYEKKVETQSPAESDMVKKPVKVKKIKNLKQINALKKIKLKKRLEAERRKIYNAKKQKENLKKLNELREKYLIKIDEGNNKNDEFLDDEERVIPQKKDINRYISEEPPALPILNRFRTADNIHIPIIPTRKEHISMLFFAIDTGNVAFFNSAFKNVEDPNVKNESGDTIITYSILTQKPGVIASVLNKGADPDMPNKLGYTPINIAIELLDGQALDLLFNNKADIKYIDGFGRTYLMHAARVGFLPAVELLVKNGVDINAMDNDGFTALSIAYRHKKEVIVKYLLKHGAKTWVEKPYNPQDQSLIRELENRWNGGNNNNDFKN